MYKKIPVKDLQKGIKSNWKKLKALFASDLSKYKKAKQQIVKRIPVIDWNSKRIPAFVKATYPTLHKINAWNSNRLPERFMNIWEMLVEDRVATILILLLIISAVAHSYNMFNYPYFENDEGTYLARGWAVLTSGELDIYTYYYDHVPGASYFIAIWGALTGGLFAFGDSVMSGRILMLIMHLAEVCLVFFISKKLTKSIIPGVIAITLMSLSPLSIYFHRRMLLDNIMTFWLLVTTAILLKNKLKLSDIYISALTFAIAVLTKENGILYLPLYAVFIWYRTSKESRLFSSLNWVFISGATISIYILYALIKGELVPESWLPEFMRTYQERVTLVDTLRFHLGRGNDLPFWKPGSDFYDMSWSWYAKDPFLVFTVIWSSIAGIIMSFFYKPARFVAGFLVISWWFLLRGGFVIDFYILPIIPLAGIMLGMLFMHLLNFFKLYSNSTRFIVTTCFFLVLTSIFLSMSYKTYNVNETKPQTDSLEWVKANIPANSKIVVDTALILDFKNKGGGNSPFAFVDAHPNWKAEKDPEILDQKLLNDWRNIDYVLLTHETLKQIKNGEFTLLDRYIDSADIIAEWENPDSDTFLSIDQRISTNGDWVKLLKLPDPDELILRDSWREYKKNFLVSYGQIIDPKNNDKTTSEGQSYAMMRAVIMNDKKTFDGVWNWTQAKLRNRGNDSLISWLWEKDENGEYVQTDYSTAADADVDIALALVLAYEQWGDEIYIDDAKEMIRDIWENEVFAVNGEYYLAFNTTPQKPEGIIINPSYFSPAHYRIFAKYDQVNNWNKLASDTYKQLDRLQSFQNNKTKLPPNWAIITREGNLISASKYFQDDADYYGFDSFRVVWRIALDARWFGAPEAYDYLYDIQPFYLENKAEEGLFKSVYNLDGTPVVEYAGLSTDTAFFSLASIINKPAADKYYNEYLNKVYNYNEGYWRDPKHYYDQNWVWFAVALYFNDLTYPININK